MIELRPSHETPSQFPNVRLEPGLHGIGREATNTITERLVAGDMGAHIWYPAVGQRMDYQPLVISADGLGPSPRGPLAIRDKLWAWAELPARPAVLNQTHSVYAVRGDMTTLAGLLDGKADPELTTLRENAHYDANDKLQPEDKVLLAIGGPIAAASLIAAIVALIRDKSMSRRAFIQIPEKIGWALLPATAARYVLRDRAAQTKSEHTKEMIMNILDVIKPLVFKKIWGDAKLAMLIAKEYDAIQTLGLPDDTPGAVVVGSGHADRMKELQRDPQARKKVVHDYAEVLVHGLAEITKKYPDIPEDIARNALLDHIASADILKIDDPGGPNQNPNFINLIDGLVTPVARFQSPEMLEALKPLR